MQKLKCKKDFKKTKIKMHRDKNTKGKNANF